MKEKSKTQQMREMFDKGMTKSDISKKMNVRYQFVHQVVSRYEQEKELHMLRKLHNKEN